MVLKLSLKQSGARFALGALALAGASFLMFVIVSRFVIGTLANPRVQVTRDVLQVPVEYLPNSARLNARLATAELSESDRNLAKARVHAQRAVNLSPNDYRFRITLASVEEAEGDRAAAESTLEAARLLAPKYWNVHYRLGNLLVRSGRLDESLEELRLAVAANSSLLPSTLDLVWRASRGDVNAVSALVGSNPAAKLTLAQFLVKMSRPGDAAAVFGSIDRAGRLASASESASFLNLLIAAGELGPARALWSEIAGGDRQSTLLWNGGFEADPLKDFSQFDWSFGRSEYARFAVDTAVAHSGSRSLRIEFAGLDTTRLDNEIRQLVSVRPGARYALEFYAKAGALETPEGPRVVVSSATSAEWLGSSDPVIKGTGDWQHLKFDFTVPQNTGSSTSGVYVSIKRKPKFSYDEPTRGTVWFDDFVLKEQ